MFTRAGPLTPTGASRRPSGSPPDGPAPTRGHEPNESPQVADPDIRFHVHGMVLRNRDVHRNQSTLDHHISRGVERQPRPVPPLTQSPGDCHRSGTHSLNTATGTGMNPKPRVLRQTVFSRSCRVIDHRRGRLEVLAARANRNHQLTESEPIGICLHGDDDFGSQTRPSALRQQRNFQSGNGCRPATGDMITVRPLNDTIPAVRRENARSRPAPKANGTENPRAATVSPSTAAVRTRPNGPGGRRTGRQGSHSMNSGYAAVSALYARSRSGRSARVTISTTSASQIRVRWCSADHVSKRMTEDRANERSSKPRYVTPPGTFG